MNGRPWTTHEESIVREHYGKEHPGEVGRRIGRTRSAVHQKAGKLGLAFDRRGEFGPEFETFLREKHAAGWSDREVAREWNGNVETVGIYRRRLGLPINSFNARHRAKIQKNFRHQLRHAGVRNLAELRSMVFRLRAFHRGWGSVTMLQADILDQLETGPKTRRMLCAALGRRWRGCKSLTDHDGHSVLKMLMGMGMVEKMGKAPGQVAGQGLSEYVYALVAGVARTKRKMEDAA